MSQYTTVPTGPRSRPVYGISERYTAASGGSAGRVTESMKASGRSRSRSGRSRSWSRSRGALSSSTLTLTSHSGLLGAPGTVAMYVVFEVGRTVMDPEETGVTLPIPLLMLIELALRVTHERMTSSPGLMRDLVAERSIQRGSSVTTGTSVTDT